MGGNASNDPAPPSEDPINLAILPDSSSIAINGVLSIGGMSLEALATEFGTPLFVYDEEHLRKRCHDAVAAFGPGVAYGTKAFLCKAMAQLVAEENMMLDVATGGEFAIARAAGIPADRMIFHGNNKSVEELQTAVDEKIHHIVVDSFDEIARLKKIVAETSAEDAQRVFVRVTPGVIAHTHEYVMTGQEDSKFGFSISSGAAEMAINEILAIEGLALVGIHAHIGSQIFLLDVFEQEVAALEPLVTKFGLKELCIGGGLGVAYLNNEQAPSMAEWAATIQRGCTAAGIGEDVVVTAEPGRSIVASGAVTVYRVGTIKDLPDIRTYVSVDGGMSDNPRPVLYGSGYEAFLANDASAPRTFACRIMGKHCESGDVIVSDARLPQSVAVDDLLVTPVTGAYGHSMASNYNRIARPAVVFVRNGSTRVVVRRETVADLLRLEP